MNISIAEWSIFGAIVASLLILDLGFFHKKHQVISFRRSVWLSIFYFATACLFGLYIFYHMGYSKAEEYITGFLIEKTMAVDNIFIIAIVFQFFKIPKEYQARVLMWGVLGVLVFRGVMIWIGAILIAKFSWILYLFAVILIFTGIKMIYLVDSKLDIKELYIYKFLQKHFNITSEIKSDDFFVKINNKTYATPLFVALMIIETMDILFAIDSIPAIFAITNDPYIVYTSNIFAILGLRSLFFCLSGAVNRFYYLKFSLAFILSFIGVKILVSHFSKIPTYVSLLIIITILASGIIASLVKTKGSATNKN